MQQEIADTVQTRPFFIVRFHNRPRRITGVGMEEHRIFRIGVIIPAVERLNIHRRQFPMLQRIITARNKAAQLLFTAHREPKFKQMNAAGHQHTLEFRCLAHKQQIFIRFAEAHYPLHACTVVPRTVEEHNFARCRQVLDIALEIPLAALRFSGLFQSHHPRTTRIQMFHITLNRTTFTRRITTFKQAHNTLAGFFHPALHFQQLNLQQSLFFFILTAAHARTVRIVGRQRRRTRILATHLAFMLEDGFFKNFQTAFGIAGINFFKRLKLMVRHIVLLLCWLFVYKQFNRQESPQTMILSRHTV